MSHSDEEFIPFMSFTSMRDSHRALLKDRRKNKGDEDTSEFWEAVTEFLHRGADAGAFIDNTEDREAAQSLLDYWHNQLFHAGKETPEAVLVDYDTTTQPEIPDSRCPYIGLESFNEENKHLFYGRDQLIRELLDQVLVSRLVTAVGPSGSGKSSVVLAGLLPKLEDGELPDSDTWHYYPTIVPGTAPLTQLAKLLEPDGADAAEWITENYETFLRDTNHLAKLVQADANTPAVLTIDQFEETFTLCHDEQERDAFIDNILGLVNAREARHVVILTMRVDYESYLNKVPMFQSLYEQGLVRVTAMNASELHDAIEQPAQAIGLKFEDGLIEALVREIVGEPAALPLLQFALLQLWGNRERNRITWDAYRRLGGVMEALASTADSLYNGMLKEEQNAAKRILLRLVRPGTGVEFTRGRATRRMLYQSGEANDRIDRVLEKLVNARLLRQTDGATSVNDQFEVAHEALVRNWPRLVEWLEDERVVLRHRLRFTAQAEDWDARNRDAGALLRGNHLQEALLFENLNPLEQEFLDASRAAVQQELEEKEAQQRRELEQAQKLAQEEAQRAEAEAKAAQRARNFNYALIVILLLVVSGAISLVYLQNLRQEQEEVSQEATRASVEARETAVAADRLAIVSTTDALQAATVQAMATSDNAVATAEVAANQTLVAERAVVENQAEATAQAATAQAQLATVAAQATQLAREAVQNTPEATVPNQPTATPDPIRLAVDAQINALIRDQDNMPMFYITGGSYQMGAANGADNPLHQVTVDSFFLDQFEVTVQQFADFLNRQGGNNEKCDGVDCATTAVFTSLTNLLNNLGVFEPRPGTERYPATWITWQGANAYCQAVGSRLPTEAEWEYAARGIDGRPFPWGSAAPIFQQTAVFNNNISQSLTNFFPRAFVRVDGLPDGASPFGVQGMAGGAAEWVQDWYDPEFYNSPLPAIGYNDDATSGLKVLRGGSWESTADELGTALRYALAPDDPNTFDLDNSHIGAGFRCARDTN
ncbi:MAG: SUMF1/EgtB/PvdO family nonheme iron enzyme [Ardenticatenaceae bacterium]|nr:SUMF1/EgtB/PvdO family nonheme iron enzyme [Anaerolineales bacterium]MCB8939839.1 SUMF1/EgtB/PvdO family nonheme iron enzyme [Ardenticatenaceae bacterium]MCB8975079.1 SUMF1/EgtB/PvdO family nonheme iron enzyme [Ardenticatenaceae bacterium]